VGFKEKTLAATFSLGGINAYRPEVGRFACADSEVSQPSAYLQPLGGEFGLRSIVSLPMRRWAKSVDLAKVRSS